MCTQIIFDYFEVSNTVDEILFLIFSADLVTEIFANILVNIFHFFTTMESKAAKIIKTIGIKNINNVFQFIRGVYMFIDYLLSSSFGYSLVNGWKNDKKSAENKLDHFGHLMSIRGRFSHNFAATVSEESYILRHDAYVDPVDYVLNNDQVVLMTVSPTKVKFYLIILKDVTKNWSSL